MVWLFIKSIVKIVRIKIGDNWMDVLRGEMLTKKSHTFTNSRTERIAVSVSHMEKTIFYHFV